MAKGKESEQKQSFTEFWNGKYMRRIRRTMLSGRIPKECSSCANLPYPAYTYYNTYFSNLKSKVKRETSWSGNILSEPISFDHRINKCNFKCRMCGPDSSSSIAKEILEFDGEYALPKWLRPSEIKETESFHNMFSEKEIMRSIENRKIKNIYWAGGEPTLSNFHWHAMKRIIELGLAQDVKVLYTTNLSAIKFKGMHLYDDILSHFKEFEIQASIDGTSSIGEYIRYGFKWEKWLEHFREAQTWRGNDRTVNMAICLTTLGLFDAKNLLLLSNQFKTRLNVHSVEAKPASPLSLLFFPRELMIRFLNETLNEISSLKTELNQSFFEEIEILLQQKWPEQSLKNSEDKKYWVNRMLTLDTIRKSDIKFSDFFAQKPYLYEYIAKFLPETTRANN